MASKRKTPMQLRQESRRFKIAALLMRGVTCQRKIAKLVGVTEPTIYTDVKAIRATWRKENLSMWEYAKDEQLKKIDEVEKNAWRGWLRSCGVSEKKIKKMDAQGRTELTYVQEPQSGNPKFLEVVRRCIEDRRKLMGLDEPEKIDLRAQLNLTAKETQELISNNEDYIEFRRQQLIGGPTIASLPSNGDQPGQLETFQTLDDPGYPIGTNGNGKAPVKKPKVARPRYRLEEP